jgi:Dit-like tail protein
MADPQAVSMRQPTRTSVAGWQFDAVLKEEHGQKLTVTKNPIETGVSISDHCYIDGSMLTLVGSVADIRMANAPDMYDPSIGRSNDAYQQLCDLENQLATKQLEPFEIVTSVKVYTNMVMTEIKMERDKTTSLLGRFEMSFEQIVTVDSQITTYQAVGAVGRSVAPKKNSGKVQAPAPANDQAKAAQAAAAKSTSATFGDAFGLTKFLGLLP